MATYKPHLKLTEITNILKTVLAAEVQNGVYGNGSPCTFRRAYINGKEYTLVEGGFLYEGEAYNDGEKDTYSTVTRIKEGRRDDRLLVNGVRATFAGLIADSVEDEKTFFRTC